MILSVQSHQNRYFRGFPGNDRVIIYLDIGNRVRYAQHNAVIDEMQLGRVALERGPVAQFLHRTINRVADSESSKEYLVRARMISEK